MQRTGESGDNATETSTPYTVPRELVALPVRDHEKRQRDSSSAKGMVKDRDEEEAGPTLGLWPE